MPVWIHGFINRHWNRCRYIHVYTCAEACVEVSTHVHVYPISVQLKDFKIMAPNSNGCTSCTDLDLQIIFSFKKNQSCLER